MAGDAWVSEEWLTPTKGVQVGSADADTMHADQRLSRPRSGGRVGLDEFKSARFLEDNGLHGFLSPRIDRTNSSNRLRAHKPTRRDRQLAFRHNHRPAERTCVP